MSCSGTDRELRTADPGTPAEKLLRLKRSLTFMRSKSVENFFQRSQSDAYPPTELFSGALPSSPRLFTGPAPGNSSVVLPSPSISSRPAPFVVQPRPAQTHSFLEHVFRRPTSCSLCKLIIAGNSKQGLRCRTCKMGAHLWCVSEFTEKPCQGKSGMFKRNLSTPVLTNGQLYAVKTQESKAQLDPVYATLRIGTSLANTSRSSFGSFCESPSQSLDEEDGQQKDEYVSTEGEKLTENQRTGLGVVSRTRELRTKVELGVEKTEAELVGARTVKLLEGCRNPVEPQDLRTQAYLQVWRSEVEPGG
ncbi:SH3 and cysteine-rich domain-containing protein 2-like [Sinocyclocheilus rhinocerous]|uniref:SH3 and cysteine-rich domain-containing protein 2-like n=1 Tax=Sinocyclocheilus rhinocerous TaxID=307959 RepID=UPI0007B9E2E3|nr:PREDICTED: SH3 and cysteine-rich domain-containing protein 2-like [Sinocyclocheilus rhinocerous]